MNRIVATLRCEGIAVIDIEVSSVKFLQSIQQTIDLTAAVLLLTGQTTIPSVILSTGAEFRLSLTGPILGGPRSVGLPEVPGAALTIDAVDAAVALLLILGQVQIVGLFIQSQRINLLVGGPPFGGSRLETYAPAAAASFRDLRKQIFSQYGVSSTKARK